MGLAGGPNLKEDGLVFYYDTGNNVKSYIGEPNTNYIHHQNAVAQNSYSSYVWTTDGTWQAKHSKAIRAYNTAGSDITGYVNGGVGNPTNVYHAHWQYDEVLKKPVVVMEDFDASWKAKSYGTGIPSWESLGKTVGSTYTISWLQWTGNLSKSARVGLYTRNPSNSYNFWDGLLASSTAKNTELYTWQRVYQTYTTSSSRNLSDAYATIYMYGHYDARATIKIADVQFDWGSYPKQFSPNPTRTVTEGLLDLTGNNTIDLSNVSFDSNAQMVFDGTDDIITTDFPVSTISNVTIEAVVYRNQATNRYEAIIQNNVASDDALYVNPSGYLMFWPCASSTLTVPIGQWSHVAVSFNGSTLTYIVNGTVQALAASCSHITDWDFLRIGGYSTTDSERWIGKIAVAKVYNQSLSSSQLIQNYQGIRKRFNL
jgi:hypothetical protein